MSRPAYLPLQDRNVPPRFGGFPNRLLLRPSCEGIPDRQTGAFLMEPGCAGEAVNDPALDAYLKAKVPVVVYARRARDLRFLRRAESFLRRGYAAEVLP